MLLEFDPRLLQIAARLNVPPPTAEEVGQWHRHARTSPHQGLASRDMCLQLATDATGESAAHALADSLKKAQAKGAHAPWLYALRLYPQCYADRANQAPGRSASRAISGGDPAPPTPSISDRVWQAERAERRRKAQAEREAAQAERARLAALSPQQRRAEAAAAVAKFRASSVARYLPPYLLDVDLYQQKYQSDFVLHADADEAEAA